MTDPLTTPRDTVVETAMAFRSSLGGPTQQAALVDLMNACQALQAAELQDECAKAIAGERQRIADIVEHELLKTVEAGQSSDKAHVQVVDVLAIVKGEP